MGVWWEERTGLGFFAQWRRATPAAAGAPAWVWLRGFEEAYRGQGFATGLIEHHADGTTHGVTAIALAQAAQQIAAAMAQQGLRRGATPCV